MEKENKREKKRTKKRKKREHLLKNGAKPKKISHSNFKYNIPQERKNEYKFM